LRLPAALLLLTSVSAAPAQPAAGLSLGHPAHEADSRLTLELQPESIVGPRLEAMALLNLARVRRARGELDDARRQLEEALLLFESVRNQVGDGGRSYFTSKRSLYDIYIDVLMRLHEREPDGGHEAAALAASERARDRPLFEAVDEGPAIGREDVDINLLPRERPLQARVNAAAERAVTLRSSTSPEHLAMPFSNDDEARLDEALRQYRAVRRPIRAPDLRSGAPAEFETLDVRAIQHLLDEDTVLLEYWLGEERSVVWAVTRDAIEAATLAPRARIGALARLAYAEQATPETSTTPAGPATVELSDAVLAPVSRRVQAKRVLIVSDGVLLNVAFAALVMPAKPGEPRRLLIEDHEIAYAPSVSAVAAQRASSSATRHGVNWTVAVIADPVFSRDDPRVRGVARDESLTTESRHREQPADRAERESGVRTPAAPLPRLSFSRAEAESIVRLLPSSQVMKAVGFDASRATVTSGALAHSRIVHFATHGLLDPLHPLLSGIVLSLVDDRGEPQDGFLSLHDVYNLQLPVELVVLSACHTAFSEESDIHGLVGLTRGFMHAGAPRVIASLWKIDDEATAELMRHFYEHLLSAQTVSAASALRAAQSELQRSRRWKSPYYWAGFVLQGDWR
jgi:CHAT domain-containing protein